MIGRATITANPGAIGLYSISFADDAEPHSGEAARTEVVELIRPD